MNQDDIQQSVFSTLNAWWEYSHDAGIQTLIANPEISLNPLPKFKPDDDIDYNAFKEIMLRILHNSMNADEPIKVISNHGITVYPF